jgi:hypothetical protein
MLTNRLMRLSGLTAIAGGMLMAICSLVIGLSEGMTDEEIPMSVLASSGTWQIVMPLMMVSMVLLLLGLVGIYRHQAETAGGFGLVGFVFAFVGTTLGVALMWVFAFVMPALAEAAAPVLDTEEPPGILGPAMFLSFLLFSIGWLIFGVASLRARVYPILASVFLILGAVIGYLIEMLPFQIPIPLDILFMAIAIAWMGWIVWLTTKPKMLRQGAEAF